MPRTSSYSTKPFKEGRKWLPKTPRLGQIMDVAKQQAQIEHHHAQIRKRAKQTPKKQSRAKTDRQIKGIYSAEICRAKFLFYEILLVQENLKEECVLNSLRLDIQKQEEETAKLKQHISQLESLTSSNNINPSSPVSTSSHLSQDLYHPVSNDANFTPEPQQHTSSSIVEEINKCDSPVSQFIEADSDTSSSSSGSIDTVLDESLDSCPLGDPLPDPLNPMLNPSFVNQEIYSQREQLPLDFCHPVNQEVNEWAGLKGEGNDEYRQDIYGLDSFSDPAADLGFKSSPLVALA